MKTGSIQMSLHKKISVELSGLAVFTSTPWDFLDITISSNL